MDSEGVFEKDHQNEELLNQNRTICLHTFSDLSYIPPLTFVYLLKECYLYGTRKATFKFRVLQHHVLQALSNAPEPGPATFVVRCLYILPLLGPLYTEGFSHLMLSSLRHLQVTDGLPVDSSKAKYLASRLLLDVLARYITHEERILVKLLEVFEIELKDIGEVICTLEENDSCLDIAKAHIEQYVSEFIESGSYMTAVTLLEHFSIGHSGQFGHSLLVRMMEDNQFNAAEKLAALMGKPMICLLVQKYIDMKMLKNAFDIMNKNNLKQEFPDLYYLYKESSLKKFAEKGCWDVAEVRTNKDKQLLEYLVYLALEAGYTEKVHELCERYSLSGFTDLTVPEVRSPKARYLQLKELISDDIVWVEEIRGLLTATSYIEGCKVVGIDCEWKPTYEKGSQPNKVSIIQIASEKKVFIFDLIKLYLEESKALDDCFKRILCSPKIMKLGYNLQCDLRQLSHSYGDLECFRNYEMLLDIEKLFKECKGGLSALAKKILGAGLNKTRRNSNWEQRPLSQNQIEYAALDAAVLVHIFRYVCGQPPAGVKEEKSKIEWRSHIISHMGCTRGACNS